MNDQVKGQQAQTEQAPTDAIKKLFVEYKKTQERLQQLEQQQHEPLAIIGASCRFPGGANNLTQFWQILSDGVNTITPVDAKRWRHQDYYAAEQAAPGKMYTSHGGYLQWALDQFDHQFFAVSPKEAKALDPQQRLLLEVAWEAMETAALDPTTLKGSATGVFIGMSSDDYAHAHLKSGLPQRIDAYSMTGSTHSTAAGRLSYTFGFEGPAMVIDTACSSSNVALHLACQSLRQGESNLALVGGVNLILTPIAHIAFTKLQAISPHGIVRTFDADASGYVRAEGCGVVVLKRLSDAQRDGDPILALVRGTAINQDGRSNGFTAPSGLAQQKVIRQALVNAGLAPCDIDYVETHGTGTPLGDPIEVEALQQVYGEARLPTQPLRLGSVKTNLGHLEPAAAVSGLIKLLLSLQHRQLPASLNFATPNPHINWQAAPVAVVQQHTDWHAPQGVRRAGLSSFGFSGTNSHVIVEEAPQQLRQLQPNSHQLLMLSGRTLPALRQQAAQFAEFLANPAVELADLAYTSCAGRSMFNERLSLVVSDSADAIGKLNQVAAGQIAPEWRAQSQGELKRQRIAMQFTGQGSQYRTASYELYQQQAVFKQAFDEVAALVADSLSPDLAAVLWQQADDSLLNQTSYAQPAIFALQYAQARLWQSMGIEPKWVSGHSIGEYAAAVIAGVFSLSDAVRLVVARGRLMQQAPGEGAMLAVFADRAAVESLLLGYRGKLSVAAVNAVDVTVVSGDKTALAQLQAECQQQQLDCRELVVSHGFHSPLMEPVLAEFAQIAATVQYHEPQITFVSALTGRPERKALTRPEYWVAHIREAVLYLPVLQYLLQDGAQVLLEVGATDTLTGLARRLCSSQLHSPGAAQPALIASQKRGQHSYASFLAAVGQLALLQPVVGVKSLFEQQQARRIAAPTYPFQRESHWVDPVYDFSQSMPGEAEPAGVSAGQHPLLGLQLRSPAIGEQLVYQRSYTATVPFFMTEHLVYNTPISPAAAHVSLLLSAARDGLQQQVAVLEQIDFLAPLIARTGEQRLGQVILTPQHDQQSAQPTYQFSLVSRDGMAVAGEFMTHCQGKVLTGEVTRPAALDLNELRARFTRTVDIAEFNDFFSSLGFQLGDGFRRIQQVFKGHNEGLTRLTQKADVPDQDIYLVYPGLIDSLFHTSLPVSELDFAQLQQDRRAFIPISIGRVCLYSNALPAEVWAYTRDHDVRAGSDVMTSDITVCDQDGQVLLTIEGITAKRSAESVLLRNLQVNASGWVYQQDWQQTAVPLTSEARRFVLLPDQQGLAGALALALQAQGNQVCLLWRSSSELLVAQAAWPSLVHQQLDWHQTDELGPWLAQQIASGVPTQLVLAESLQLEPAAEYEAGLASHYGALLQLVQQLLQRDPQQLMQLWLLAREDDAAGLAQAPLVGLAKVLGLEQPDMLKATVLLPASLQADQLQALADLLQAGPAAGEQLWRLSPHSPAALQVARIDRARLTPAQRPFQLKSQQTYLITGALGALGRQVVSLLAQKGARKLLLTGRRALSQQDEQWLAELAQDGVQARYVSADLSDAGAVQQLISADLAGVFHCAGSLDDGLLNDQSLPRLHAVFAAKALGAWHLHQLTRELALDCFVLFSSVTALFGSPGQSNYVAANMFLNSLAQWRQAQGLAALSINWGPWLEGGMASADEKRGDRLASRGIEGLRASDAIDVLWQFISQPAGASLCCPAVVVMDWQKYQQYAAPSQRQALLSRLLSQDVAVQTSHAADTSLLQALQSAPPEQRAALLVEQISAIAARVLGYSQGAVLDVEVPLMDLGADSLMMVEARSQIAAAYQLKLPASFFFNYPTLQKAAEQLGSQLFTQAPVNVANNTADVLADIAALLD